MKNGWIAAGVMLALVACTQGDHPPPPATATGWDSTRAGSSLPASEGAAGPTLGTESPAEANRISIPELRQKLATGSVVLVDVRDPQSHAFLRAEGAVSIPLHEVAARATELPRDKQIVTYCT